MENHYELNVAIVTTRPAWNSTPAAPLYTSTHFCRIDLGRDETPALQKAADIAARFPEGDKPGEFHLSLTYWQASGHGVEFARHAVARDPGEAAAINAHNAKHAAHASAHGWPLAVAIQAAQGEAAARAGGPSEAYCEAIAKRHGWTRGNDGKWRKAGHSRHDSAKEVCSWHKLDAGEACDHAASRADGVASCKACGATIDYPFHGAQAAAPGASEFVEAVAAGVTFEPELPSLTDGVYDHGPEAWAELAARFEKERMFHNAAKAWKKAAQASAGHNRRARYEEAAARCLALGDN